jgi:hypothetical protein
LKFGGVLLLVVVVVAYVEGKAFDLSIEIANCDHSRMVMWECKRSTGVLGVIMAPVVYDKMLYDTSWALLEFILGLLRPQVKSLADLCNALAWEFDCASMYTVVRENPIVEAGQMNESLHGTEQKAFIASST